MRWVDGISKSMDMSLGKLQVVVKYRKALHAAVPGVTKSQIWLSDSTTTMGNLEASYDIMWEQQQQQQQKKQISKQTGK